MSWWKLACMQSCRCCWKKSLPPWTLSHHLNLLGLRGATLAVVGPETNGSIGLLVSVGTLLELLQSVFNRAMSVQFQPAQRPLIRNSELTFSCEAFPWCAWPESIPYQTTWRTQRSSAFPNQANPPRPWSPCRAPSAWRWSDPSGPDQRLCLWTVSYPFDPRYW